MPLDQPRHTATVYQILLILLTFAVILTISIMASVPPVSRDALIHHLAIPKLYLKNGGMYEIPSLWFSYFPMNITLLYAIPLYFGNDVLAKFIHFAFAIGTAILICRYLKRRLGLIYGLLGALLFLTIPVVVRLSTTAYVDLGLIFFLFAALLYLFDWIEADFQIKYLLISAIFCGLALGTKYNGLVGFFLLSLFVPFVYSRYKSDEKLYGAKAIGYCVVFFLAALIVFSPWMIRNYIWTGNPVYPLYNGLFNPKTSQTQKIDEFQEKASPGMNHLQIRRDIYKESNLEIVLIPLRVFFQGQDDNPKYFDGRLNPFLLLLPILALCGIRNDTRKIKTEKLIFFYFSILVLLISCAQISIRIRYFSSIVPPLVILSIFGLQHLQKMIFDFSFFSKKIKKLCALSVVGVMLSLNGFYIIQLFNSIKPFHYIVGKVNRDDYIQHYRPEYASMQYANKNLSSAHKILGVYLGNRGYYSDIDIEFSISVLQHLAAQAEFPKDISVSLIDRKISHLLINFELFNIFVDNYSMHEKQVLKDFFDDYVITEFSKDGYGLLRIIT